MNVTQKEIAQKLYISDKTYSQYERGERNIETMTLFKIIELLKINIDEVMTVDLGSIKEDLVGYENEIILNLQNTRITKRKRGFLFLIIARFYNHIKENEKGENPLKMGVKVEKAENGFFNMQLTNINGVFPYEDVENRNDFYTKLIEDIKKEKTMQRLFGRHITPMLAHNKKIAGYSFEGNKNDGTIFNVLI